MLMFDRATRFNPYSDAMIIDMKDLRPPETFTDKLLKVKQYLAKTHDRIY